MNPEVKRLSLPRMLNNSIRWCYLPHLIRRQLVDMDRIVRAVLLAEFTAYTGFYINMHKRERALNLFSPLHLETFRHGTPMDTVFTANAGILFHQRLHFGLGCLSRLRWCRSYRCFCCCFHRLSDDTSSTPLCQSASSA